MVRPVLEAMSSHHVILQALVLKTWPNCQNRFYSAGEDAVVRLWALDKGESSPGECKVNGKVRRTCVMQRCVIVTISKGSNSTARTHQK